LAKPRQIIQPGRKSQIFDTIDEEVAE